MLEQEIRSDIEERRDLMRKIKTLSSLYQINEKDELPFLIYSIPTIYATWEGFVQTSFRLYIQELNKQDLTIDSVCSSLAIFYFEKKFPQLKQYPTESKGKESFFKSLDKLYNERSIKIPESVETKSNVRFSTITSLATTFNLEKIPEYIKHNSPEYEYTYIDKSKFKEGYLLKENLNNLVDRRNEVAHGNSHLKPQELQKELRTKREELSGMIELVEILMELIFQRITSGFESQSYLN